jgi:RNA polymerase sigma-70 factor (ECF subfamily)
LAPRRFSHPTVTDEWLMRAVREGDLTRMGVLFERHHRPLFEFLYRMTGDRGAAEDLVQDVFVRMLRYRATYRDEGKFETWMFRIARNARADHFRKHSGAVYVPEDDMDWASDAPGPGHLLERARDLLRLRRAMQSLREDRRELIVLVRYQGMTHEQVGAILGVDTGTVKVRFHRALKELRDAFARVPEGD